MITTVFEIFVVAVSFGVVHILNPRWLSYLPFSFHYFFVLILPNLVIYILVVTRCHLVFLNIMLTKDVKVEKLRPGTFWLRISLEKGGDKLVAILEAFDEMCLNVQQARVSCNDDFSMEAIAVAEDQTLDVRDITEALLKAIGKPTSGDEKNSQKLESFCKLTTP